VKEEQRERGRELMRRLRESGHALIDLTKD
jgi:hypothetical protein